MSFTPKQSALFQNTQSPLYQRGGGPFVFTETMEAFMLNATSDTGNPPASPTSLLTALYAKDWADLSALTFQDVSTTGGLNIGLTKWRGMHKEDSGSYAEVTDFLPTGFAGNNFSADTGNVSYDPQTTISSIPHFYGASGTSFDPLWPVQPRPGGDLYQGQRVRGCIGQSSFWIWRPDRINLGGGTYIGSGKVDVETWRSRCKFNQASTHCFLASGEIWAEKSDHTVGWNVFSGGSGRDCTFFRLVNCTVLSTFSLSAGTYYEVPAPDDDDTIGAFSAGFVGRMNFAIFFETPAEFAARTGVTLL